MPNHKNLRNHRNGKEADQNNNPAPLEVNIVNNNQPVPINNITLSTCCKPMFCPTPDEMIDPNDPGKSVRVACNNEQCPESQWMHKCCFDDWEESVLAYLRSCGRARSWSEKQRLQNLWTKKGYDLAFKACDCRCGRGHLRKNLDYIPPPVTDNARRNKKGKKKTEKATTTNGSSAPKNATNVAPTNNHNPQVRVRTDSVGSTGSSPPHSNDSGSPTPMSPDTPTGNVCVKKSKFEFFADINQAALGNIFKRRNDLSAFSILPRHRRNPYNIKMEDEGPHGNDDTRCFVLSNLSTYKITNLQCVLCRHELPVFDRYPLIDGTFFLSPQCYGDSVIQVLSDSRIQYLNAVCVTCIEGGTDVRCFACKSKWNGRTLLLGSMYSYDIFAAMPCCQKRLTCKTCRRAVIDIKAGLPYYSEYSRCLACPYCKTTDHHFVRPLTETFLIKQPIWN